MLILESTAAAGVSGDNADRPTPLPRLKSQTLDLLMAHRLTATIVQLVATRVNKVAEELSGEHLTFANIGTIKAR